MNKLSLLILFWEKLLKNKQKLLKIREKKLDKISEMEKDVDRGKLVYKTNIHTYDFQTFQTIRTFAGDIYNGEISLGVANEDQEKLLDEIVYFNKKTKPKIERKKERKRRCYEKLA